MVGYSTTDVVLKLYQVLVADWALGTTATHHYHQPLL
jgi:hypothetical protein